MPLVAVSKHEKVNIYYGEQITQCNQEGLAEKLRTYKKNALTKDPVLTYARVVIRTDHAVSIVRILSEQYFDQFNDRNTRHQPEVESLDGLLCMASSDLRLYRDNNQYVTLTPKDKRQLLKVLNSLSEELKDYPVSVGYSGDISREMLESGGDIYISPGKLADRKSERGIKYRAFRQEVYEYFNPYFRDLRYYFNTMCRVDTYGNWSIADTFPRFINLQHMIEQCDKQRASFDQYKEVIDNYIEAANEAFYALIDAMIYPPKFHSLDTDINNLFRQSEPNPCRSLELET